ncbi:uncharacterized protein LOC134244723 isoform X2 [Saccostrea cucullata]|uniref:uncharacterized protein LOC134244723 isoform X2 n=1 Tax=Saccostrea cuccullata TaxID=36930 RepID=UPI002ED5E78A
MEDRHFGQYFSQQGKDTGRENDGKCETLNEENRHSGQYISQQDNSDELAENISTGSEHMNRIAVSDNQGNYLSTGIPDRWRFQRYDERDDRKNFYRGKCC